MYNFKRLTLLVTLACLISGCAGSKPNIFIPKRPPRIPQLRQRPRVALVLGSGGARGFAHIGVLQVLHNAGVPIDLIVGASSGSLIGALYADSDNPAKVYKIMMKAGFWSLADISNIPSLKGVISGYHFDKFLLHNMQARSFRQLKTKLVVATTDIKTGKSYIIQSGPIAPACMASAALPGAVIPQHLYGHTLIDGGVANPIPVNIARRFKPKVIIAVNISQDLDRHLPYTALGIYSRAYDIMWENLSEFSQRNANVVIRPKVGQAGTFDINDKYQLYLDGYYAAKKALPKILKLLKQKHIALEIKK